MFSEAVAGAGDASKYSRTASKPCLWGTLSVWRILLYLNTYFVQHARHKTLVSATVLTIPVLNVKFNQYGTLAFLIYQLSIFNGNYVTIYNKFYFTVR